MATNPSTSRPAGTGLRPVFVQAVAGGPAAALAWLRSSPGGLLVLALATGLGAGVGAIVFRGLIVGFTVLFTGQTDPGGQAHPVHPAFQQLGPWFIVGVPVVGGLLYGPLVERFAREARGHGVPEVMLAVAERGGRIRPRVAVVKSLASAICLGSGGSVGREGPIVQIGSALGSTIGQALSLGESRVRLLVACGAAAGISATFNAPIAGVFFALELILQDFEVRSFGAVVVSSVAADIVGRAAFGTASFLPLPPFQIVSVWEFGLYAILGVAAAFTGIAFVRVLYGMEDLLDRLWDHRPEWLRPAVGGIALGLLLLVLPGLYGVGYTPLEQAISGQMAVQLVVLLLVGKIFATSLTIGIGGSGGVFAPSLFIGGMLGTAFGVVANALAPGLVAPAGAYGLVGMGAVFAAASHAPITAVIILFELTGDYQIILPMMLAIALAAGASSLLTNDTIYTLKLRRRGIDIRRGSSASLMELLTVGDAMGAVPAALAPETALLGAVEELARQHVDALPVVDAEGAYRGTVTSEQLEDCMRSNTLDATAGELAQPLPPLRSDETLQQALDRLVRQGSNGLPVVAPDEGRLVGWLTHHDVLAGYSARLRGIEEKGEAPGRPHRAGVDVPATDWLRRYRVVELEFAGDSPAVGHSISSLDIPALALPIALRRNGTHFTPAGDTMILRGDRLTLLVEPDEAENVAERLTSPPDHPD